MDRRIFLKGAAAVTLLPMLPAIAPADRETVVTIDNNWHHYAVTKKAVGDCAEYKAFIDGVEVTRPSGFDYDVLEDLTIQTDSLPLHNSSMTAEVWRLKDGDDQLYDGFRVTTERSVSLPDPFDEAARV